MTFRGLLVLAGLAASASQVAASNYPYSSSCCNTLQGALPGKVFRSNDTAYTELNQRWSNTSILAPSCVVAPTSAEDVSDAVKLLVAASCEFAVKSGGHNPIPGSNNIDGGVSMVLGGLNQTVLSEDRSYVSLGTGARWGQVYAAMADDGILVPGGLCGGTGIGGVATGGGESYLLASHGWVVDNVVNYEVVLASGEIVNANQTSNSDLYRALKGGGNNFGIVTRVDMAAIEQPQIWGGSILIPYFPDSALATLYAITNFTADNNVYPNNGAQVIVTYTSTGDALIALSLASTDGTVNSTGLEPFTSLQPQIANTVGLRTISDIVTELDTNQADGFRDTAATITFINDPQTLIAVHNASDQIYLGLNATVPDLDWVVFYVPTSKADGTHAATRGGNLLGLDDEENDLLVAFITPRWLDPQYDDIMYEAAETWHQTMKSITESMGTAHPFLYSNFAAKTQKPLCGYGAENVGFMQRVSEKYDPQDVFQTLVPGGFKVNQAC